MSQEYIRQYKTISIDKPAVDMPLYDDFEDTLIKWTISKVNSSGGATRDTTAANKGGASLKLDTGGTSPAINDNVTISRTFGQVNSNIIAASLRFSIQISGFVGVLWEKVYITNPATGQQYAMGIQYRATTSTIYLEYMSALGDYANPDTYTTIASKMADSIYNKFLEMKVVVDINKGEYLYAIFNGKRYNLTGIKLPSQNADLNTPNQMLIRAQTNAPAEVIIRIDDVLVAPEG